MRISPPPLGQEDPEGVEGARRHNDLKKPIGGVG
jgi:hypothetical protein